MDDKAVGENSLPSRLNGVQYNAQDLGGVSFSRLSQESVFWCVSSMRYNGYK